jgi:hypothetical protein
MARDEADLLQKLLRDEVAVPSQSVELLELELHGALELLRIAKEKRQHRGESGASLMAEVERAEAEVKRVREALERARTGQQKWKFLPPKLAPAQ